MVLLTERESGIADRLSGELPDLSTADLGAVRAGELDDEAFDSVVVAGLLEYLDEAAVNPLLQRAWRLVRPGGRLIVTVPNEDCLEDPRFRREFDRRVLKGILQPFGKPKVAGDQPFKWLLMSVEKVAPGQGSVNRVWQERYQVTARLCRGRIAELGCGEGHLVKLLADRGHEVVGVDISGARIERARERYPDLTFRQCDIRDLAERDEFDTVILAEVLEHVPALLGDELLETAWRLVRPGGRLIVSVPNEDAIPHPNHVREFSRRSLRRLLRPLGLVKVVTDQPFKWLLMYVTKTPEDPLTTAASGGAGPAAEQPE